MGLQSEAQPDLDRLCSDLRLALRRLVEHSTHLHPYCFQLIVVTLAEATLVLEDIRDGHYPPADLDAES